MKRKKLLCVIIALCMMLSFMPVKAEAEEIASGECGPDLTWTLDAEGTLTVSGTGPMWDFADYWDMIPYEEEWGIRYEYEFVDLPDPEWNKADVIRVVIEEGVTNIGSGAFKGCTNLTQVTLPTTVTEISEEAFRGCASLTEFTIPETVTILGIRTFEMAGGTTYTHEGAYTFAGTGITSLTIPGSIAHVPDHLMYDTHSLRELVFEEGVESVGSCAFQDCENLESVVIPDSLSGFGYQAFHGCYKLRENYESVRQELTFGQPLPDKIEIPDLYSRYYTFTPTESREYRFTSLGYTNTEGTLYDQDMNQLAQDKDSGEGPKFAFTQFLEAGETYTLKVDLFTYGGMFSTESNGAYEILVDYGHTYVPTVIREPSCEGDGIVQYRCGCCGDSYEEIIPGGHSYENGVCTRCGNGESYGFTGTPANPGEDGLIPTGSNNRDDHFYDRLSAAPINSHLRATENGYLRAEHINGKIYVEEYDRDFRLLSKTELALELPIYGGIHLGEHYNFVVCGQTNREEDDNKEVIRVIRYSKDWVREDAASLHGANTTVPFDFSTVRFAECEDMFYIRTGHEIYTRPDGLNHQTNMTLGVRISDMEITINHTEVSGRNFGYVSHSFDQFLCVDGNDLLALDLGDCYPRAVVFNAAIGAAGQYNFTYTDYAQVPVFWISQTPTYQYTGVSLGGLNFSDTHYLAVGNTVDQSQATADPNGQRNIFVSSIPKANPTEESTVTRYLTNHTGGVRLSPPHLTKVDDNRFFLTWTENGTMRYCFLNGSGELTSEIFTGEGQLSDCEPIYHNGCITWYVTNRGVPTFYQLELYHIHRFGDWTVTDATCTEPGGRSHSCSACGHTETEELPALGHDFVDGTCTRCGEVGEGEAPTHVPGDITGDGEVNNKDLTRLFRYLSGFKVEVNEAALDITGDGAVNNKDLTRLFRFLSGFDVEIF